MDNCLLSFVHIPVNRNKQIINYVHNTREREKCTLKSSPTNLNIGVTIIANIIQNNHKCF